MNILIAGATRGVGRQLVELSLEAGHRVTALVRQPASMDLDHPALRVIGGGAHDPAAIDRAMPGQDAVFICLGAPATRRHQVRAEGTAALVEGMARHGVQRVVCLSALGVRESREVLPWYLKYLMLPLYLRWAYADHAVQEEILEGSTLDWTIVRPPFLTDDAATGDYAHGFDDLAGLDLKIPRADVAGFMLGLAPDSAFHHTTTAVSC